MPRGFGSVGGGGEAGERGKKGGEDPQVAGEAGEGGRGGKLCAKILKNCEGKRRERPGNSLLQDSGGKSEKINQKNGDQRNEFGQRPMNEGKRRGGPGN